MDLIRGTAERYLGLCRKPPAVITLQADPEFPLGSVLEGPPDRRAGRPGAIGRGTGAATSGLKILVHNPQLLWFTLLAALVLPGFSIIRGAISTAASSLEWQAFIDPSISMGRFTLDPFITRWWPAFYPHNARLLYSLVMEFATTVFVEFITVFFLVFLLAGLVLSLSHEKDGTVSFFQGITQAARHIRSIARWSMVMALVGTLLFIACQYAGLPDLKVTQFLWGVLSQSPFNYIFTTNIANIFPGGQFGFLGLQFFTRGLVDILLLFVINVLLISLTLFVVPLLVLKRWNLKKAVLGSFGLLKKTWTDVTACITGLVTIVCAVLLASLLFPVLAGGNIAVGYWPPPDGWLAAGFLYVLILYSLAFILATIGGIALLCLYRSAQTGQEPKTA